MEMVSPQPLSPYRFHLSSFPTPSNSNYSYNNPNATPTNPTTTPPPTFGPKTAAAPVDCAAPGPDVVAEGASAFSISTPPTLVEFLHSSSERRVAEALMVISAHYVRRVLDVCLSVCWREEMGSLNIRYGVGMRGRAESLEMESRKSLH